MRERPSFDLHLAVIPGGCGCGISGFPTALVQVCSFSLLVSCGCGMGGAGDLAKLQRHPRSSNSVQYCEFFPGGPGIDLLLLWF